MSKKKKGKAEVVENVETVENVAEKVEGAEIPDVAKLAEELGLDLEALTQADQVELEEPDAPKKSRKSKKDVEKVTRKRVADLTPEGEIHGFPVNHLQKPLELDERGNPKEIVVTFTAGEVEDYRETKGRIFLEIHKGKFRKKGGDKLKVFAEFIGKERELLLETNNHSRGWKRAKTWAVLLNLAFDPNQDVAIYEVQETYEVQEVVEVEETQGA